MAMGFEDFQDFARYFAGGLNGHVIGPPMKGDGWERKKSALIPPFRKG